MRESAVGGDAGLMWFKKEPSAKPDDITQAVNTARRGLRRDVKVLCEAVKTGSLYIALAKSLRPESPENPENSFQLRPGETIAAYRLTNEHKQTASALFTNTEILGDFARRMNWTTDGGPVHYVRISAKTALEVALADIKAGHDQMLVINAGDDSQLQLDGEELESLVKCEPIPLVHYIRDLPTIEGEACIVGQPATPPPIELRSAIESYVKSHAGLQGYDLFQLFNTERDRESHLALNIRTSLPERDWPDVSREILALLSTVTVPPPGYLDIVFNSSLAKNLKTK